MYWAKRKKQKISRRNYEGHGAFTSADGYATQEEVERAMKHFWNKGEGSDLRNMDGLIRPSRNPHDCQDPRHHFS